MTLNGQTYERAFISDWFKSHSTDPCTNAVVAKTLIPNRALKDAIEEFVEKDKELSGKQKALTEGDHTKASHTNSSSSLLPEPQTPTSKFPWLAHELSSTTHINPTDIASSIQVLLEQGIDCPEVLAGIEESEFTATYLASVGIKKLGVQQHLLRVHKKLRGAAN